jgi:hypothetical protein
MAQYDTMPLHVKFAPENDSACDLLEDLRKCGEVREPSWEQVEKGERALLTMLQGDQLRRHAWMLRDEFEQSVGKVPSDEALLKAYEKSNPPNPATDSEEAVRADLLALQDRLHALKGTRRVQLRARNLIAAFTVALSAVAVVGTLQLDKWLKMEDTIIFDVFGIGMLGGLFSTLIRIQKFKMGGSYDACALSQPGNQLTVMLSPAVGGAGAVILFAALASGVLKGTLFPEIPTVEYDAFTDALEDLFKVHLASSIEAAKLYLYCFLAGFSERLVPDVLTRLASNVERAK